MAGTTGFEPATSDVTGRRSNQLNYVPTLVSVRTYYSSTRYTDLQTEVHVNGGYCQNHCDRW